MTDGKRLTCFKCDAKWEMWPWDWREIHNQSKSYWCPKCGTRWVGNPQVVHDGEKIDRLERLARQRLDASERRLRRINALRGVITKLKKSGNGRGYR